MFSLPLAMAIAEPLLAQKLHAVAHLYRTIEEKPGAGAGGMRSAAVSWGRPQAGWYARNVARHEPCTAMQLTLECTKRKFEEVTSRMKGQI